eukprot:1192918-Prorocentrum_minimum.AAC.4
MSAHISCCVPALGADRSLPPPPQRSCTWRGPRARARERARAVRWRGGRGPTALPLRSPPLPPPPAGWPRPPSGALRRRPPRMNPSLPRRLSACRRPQRRQLPWWAGSQPWTPMSPHAPL